MQVDKEKLQQFAVSFVEDLKILEYEKKTYKISTSKGQNLKIKKQKY